MSSAPEAASPAPMLDGLTRRLATQLNRPLPPPLVIIGALALLTGVMVGVAVVDRLTGPLLNLAVLYVLVAIAGAVLLGVGPGAYLAALGTVAWAVGEPVSSPGSSISHYADGVLRFLAVLAATLLVEALRRATRQAVASDRRARDFLGLAAHQMRTPVAALRASSETLVGLGASPEQEPFLADIAFEANRIGRLLSNLLWAARLDSGAGYPVRSCDPVAICQDELRRAERSHPELALRLTAGPVPRLGLAEDVLRETLVNLLENASRHARTAVEVGLAWGPTQLVLTVTDDGSGLPPALEEEAFRRFVSLDGGMGLGLAVCRSAARSAGGDLVYSGGSFVLRLPLAQLD